MRWLIRLYQRYISPFLGPRCRFYPTCSEYAHQSIDRFGYLRGLLLALGRILRCHPWGICGADPIPENFSWSAVFGRHVGDDQQD
jgi:putative membrane protein insertion efficiency factor